MKAKKKIIVPQYLCGGCGLSLNYTIIVHYTIELDKTHKCKPVLKPPSPKQLEEVEELINYNKSLTKADKERILHTDNKPWWTKKK